MTFYERHKSVLFLFETQIKSDKSSATSRFRKLLNFKTDKNTIVCGYTSASQWKTDTKHQPIFRFALYSVDCCERVTQFVKPSPGDSKKRVKQTNRSLVRYDLRQFIVLLLLHKSPCQRNCATEHCTVTRCTQRTCKKKTQNFCRFFHFYSQKFHTHSIAVSWKRI